MLIEKVFDDEVDALFLGLDLDNFDGATIEEDFDIIRFCPFNFQPVCVGADFGYFECPKNPNGCLYNMDEENENFLFFDRGINL